MATTDHLSRPSSSAPWIFWGSVAVVVLLVVMTVVAVFLPRWAPEWVAEHALTYGYARRALVAGEQYDLRPIILERADQWEGTMVPELRLRLEEDLIHGLYEDEMDMFDYLGDVDLMAMYFEQRMSESRAQVAAERFVTHNRDDLLACGILLLSHPDAYRRAKGVTCLVALNDPRVRQLLEGHLDDDTRVRQSVLDALVQVGDRQSVGAILAWVTANPSSDPQECLSAIEVLVGPEPLLEQDLVRLLDHGHPVARSWAFHRLMFPTISRSAIPALVRTVCDPDDTLARRALFLLTLNFQTDEVASYVDFLKQDDERLRLGAARVLSTLGDRRGAVHLLDVLEVGGTIDCQVERLILGTLSVSDDSVPCEALSKQSAVVREWGVRQIGLRRQVGSAPALLALIDDPQPQVRAVVLRVLGAWRVPEVLLPCRRALSAESPVERLAALRALGDLGYAEDLPALRRYLVSVDPRVRQASVQALGRFKDPALAAELRAALNDPDPLVREAARMSLEAMSEDQGEAQAFEQSRLQEFSAALAVP